MGWNIGRLPVCPADMLSVAALEASGVQLRWAHRLEVYVPPEAANKGDAQDKAPVVL